jgi:hypothetical protein
MWLPLARMVCFLSWINLNKSAKHVFNPTTEIILVEGLQRA